MKGTPPKELLKRRQQKTPPKKQSAQTTILGMHPWAFWLTVFALLLSIVGLTLTALQFQARPTVSLGTPLDPANVLSTPIIISNDGLENLQDMGFMSYFKEVKYEGGGEIANATGARVLEAVHTLTAGEKHEVLPAQVVGFFGGTPRVRELDFALVVYFRPAYWPKTKRRFFRFRVAQNSDGTQRLMEVAAEDIEKDFDSK
jgi:hypothetical protein